MRNRGLTLIEVVVVISVMGILIASTGFSYAGWMRKYRVERTARSLYADLMLARVMAMDKNIAHFALLSRGSYTILEDSNDDGVDNAGDKPLPTFPRAVSDPLFWNGIGARITFDKKGLIAQSRTVWFTAADGSISEADYDCMRISRTRIIMGRHNGSSCIVK